tara:strand:- start:53727 stop:54530 length:804 start_codon:yes stop_codon:yes gene_type:complete
MTEIIAEIGWNHMGDLELAETMIRAAAENGATYAKFQTWSVSRLKDGEWNLDGRRQIYENAELSADDHVSLINLCDKHGIKFLSSVFSVPDAELLVGLNQTHAVKIPSFECRNVELVDYCNEHFEKVYMSTGTSKWAELREMVPRINKAELVLLHCVSSYPCEPNMANISKLTDLKELCPRIGYSDHIMGVESAKVALAYGLNVVEKHFTVDHDLPGRDNKFAILPEELGDLSSFIKLVDQMHEYHGLDYQPAEEGARNEYSGRFNG